MQWTWVHCNVENREAWCVVDDGVMKGWAWLSDQTTTIVPPYLKLFYSFFALFFTGTCKFLYFVPVSLSFMPWWLLPVLMIREVDGSSSTLHDYYAIQTFLFCCEADIYQTGCAFKVASFHFTTKTSVDIVLVDLFFELLKLLLSVFWNNILSNLNSEQTGLVLGWPSFCTSSANPWL